MGAEGESVGTGSDTQTGETQSCPAWPEQPNALGMGETQTLSFVDVTTEVGLTDVAYVQGDWPPGCDPDGGGVVQTPCKELLQGGGVAAGDFDSDGWPDLYISRIGRRGALLHNRADGQGGRRFVEVGLELGMGLVFDGNGAVWADLDGDGDLDLYVSAMGDPARFYLFRNRLAEDGAPGFDERAHERGLALDDGLEHWGFSIAVGDYDRDGWLDLFTSEWRPGPAVLEQGGHARLLHNLGPADPGSFEDRTEAAGASVLALNPAGVYAFAPAFVDLDEDGWLDLAVVADNGTSRLLWNGGAGGDGDGGDGDDGFGGFVDGTPTAGVGLERNGMGSTFGDLDGDGHLDWYVSAIFSPDDDPEVDCGNPICGAGGNRLYRSVGPRCFEEVGRDYRVHAGGWGWGVATWDPDNDGDIDLVETNGFRVPHGPPGSFFLGDPIHLWRNLSEAGGESVFEDQAAVAGLAHVGQGRGLITLDYDRDGDEDLLVIDNGGDTRLWRNDSGAENGWLDIEVRGAPGGGNLDAIGARIELWRSPGSPRQVRVIGVGAHFLGQGEHRAHFGLGPGDAPVARVRVTWPETGLVRELEDLEPRASIIVEAP